MRKHKIIFLGQKPPPYMGPSIATEIILNSTLMDDFDLIHLDTSDHRGLATLGKLDFRNIQLALKHYLQLIWFIITRSPDLVYIPLSQTTLGYLRDAAFILTAKFYGCKVVCHLRGGNFKNWYSSASLLTRLFVRTIHPLVDGQIVLGEKLKEMFSEVLLSEKVFVVPNGRNFNFEFDEKKSAKNMKVLYLSNMVQTRGALETLKALYLVPDVPSQVEAIFAGDFVDVATRDEFMSLMKQSDGPPITIRGSVTGDAKYEILTAADIFVFPTYYPPEGQPWVIIEAMAAGLPIITTDQGCITEMVIEGVNGFIVEKKNPEQIAEKIRIFIENPQLRIRMGQESRKRYLDKFTEEKMIERLRNTFNSVLSR